MEIKLAILKSGEQLISDVGLVAEDSSVYCLINPYEIIALDNVEEDEVYELEDEDGGEYLNQEIKIGLEPWIILSDDEKILIKKDWVVTFVNPIDDVKTMYEKKVNGKNN